jgi:hypothetical protein
VRQRNAKIHSQPSWSGAGQLDIRIRRERTTWVESVLLLAAALGVDIVSYGIASLFGAQTRIVCGYDCFPAPAADLHDARVRLWAAGIAVAVTIGGALLLRRARILIAVVQLGILAALLVYTIPVMNRAHDQMRELQRCDYGRHGPCIGIRNLGTPTGT